MFFMFFFLFSRRCRCPSCPSRGTSACPTPRGAQKWCGCTSIITASVRWRWRGEGNGKGCGGNFPATIASSSMPQVKQHRLRQREICLSACLFDLWNRVNAVRKCEGAWPIYWSGRYHQLILASFQAIILIFICWQCYSLTCSFYDSWF